MSEDNPTFITVVEILGSFHVDKMEWDTRADGYQVSISKQFHDKNEAHNHAAEWAAKEGLEYR